MLTGSCLCGRVAYEADAEIEGVIHCHCETCRKAHGAAFSSLAAVPRDRFRWIRGDAARKSFESSPGKLRHFCSECGSQIAAERAGSSIFLVPRENWNEVKNEPTSMKVIPVATFQEALDALR